jgi:cation transport ATPase
MMIVEAFQWIGKAIAIANLVWLAWVLTKDWRRRQLDMDYLWIAGIAVSGVAIQWASGLALWLAYAFWLVFIVIFAVSMVMQHRARKRRQAEINTEILRRIEDGKDGMWELTPSLTLTFETKVIEASQAVEGDADHD